MKLPIISVYFFLYGSLMLSACDTKDSDGANADGETSTDGDDSSTDTDGTETTSCIPVTEPNCSGFVFVETESEWERVQMCSAVVGAITIDGGDWLTTLEMPCLTNAGGLIIENSTALTSLEGMSLLVELEGV